MSKITRIILGLFAFTFFSYQFSNHISGAFDGRSPADFPNYYFAGKRIFENRPVYDDLKIEVKSAFGWDYTVYPADTPFTLTILSPLGLLEYKTAWLTLALLSVIAISISIYKVASELRFSRSSNFLLIGLSLSSASTIFLLKRNHMESLVLLAGVYGWIALRNSKEVTAGIWWGLASALKLFPSLWLVAALLCGNKKTFVSGTITSLICTIIGVLIVGTEDTLFFVNEIIPRSSEWYGVVANYSLISLFSAIFSINIGLKLGLISSLALFTILIIKLYRIRASANPVKTDEIIVSAFATSLLVSPLAWLNYLILVWPGLLVLLKTIDFSAIHQRWLAILIFMIFWNWPEYIYSPNYTLAILLSSAPTFGLIFLVLYSDIIGSLSHHNK